MANLSSILAKKYQQVLDYQKNIKEPSKVLVPPLMYPDDATMQRCKADFREEQHYAAQYKFKRGF